jgi:hypothetical protein
MWPVCQVALWSADRGTETNWRELVRGLAWEQVVADVRLLLEPDTPLGFLTYGQLMRLLG